MISRRLNRRAKACLFAASILAAWLSLAWPAQARPHIYFANTGKNAIGRARLDGSHVQQKFIRHTHPAVAPNDLAVSRNHLYWVTESDNLWWARMDGTHVKKIVSDVGQSVTFGGIYAGCCVFWGDYVDGTPTIGLAHSDGTAPIHDWMEMPVDDGAPWGLAVEPDTRRIYWDTSYPELWWGRVATPSQQFPEFFRTPLHHDTDGLAVDKEAGYVYWGNDPTHNGGAAHIARTPYLKPCCPSAQEKFIRVTGAAWGVDVYRHHIYWTNAISRIGRAKLNGHHVQNRFIAASFPDGIAVGGR